MGSFMTGSHHLLTDDDVSVAALWRRANRQSTLPGEVSATLSSPAAHPPSNRFSAGGYDPSWVAMAGVPVEINPLSQKHAMARPEGLSLKGCSESIIFTHKLVRIVWLPTRTYTYAR